jgi:queuine tRNA-ribosyltransferase
MFSETLPHRKRRAMWETPPPFPINPFCRFQTAAPFAMVPGPMSADAYELVRLPGGACSIRSHASAETFHPVVGAAEEARILYADQLHLARRAAETSGEFVIWDIGLGGAANACAALHALHDTPCRVRLISLDRTSDALRFALQHAVELDYFGKLTGSANNLLADGETRFQFGQADVVWSFVPGEIPRLMANIPSPNPVLEAFPPHAILFDPCSIIRNPEMWTLPFFESLFLRLDPSRPCSLSTYSRSTMIRVTLLLAGFHVGQGGPTGLKEETTVAANDPALLARPLPLKWLTRVRISGAAEPMIKPLYRQTALEADYWIRLLAHPQFNH